MEMMDMVHIKHFSIDEIKNNLKSQSDFDKLDYNLIHNLDRLRQLVGVPISILDINRGESHIPGSYHAKLKAVDFYFPNMDNVKIIEVILLMADVGFKGIGVYLNKSGVYSFHGDIRNSSLISSWSATKSSTNSWIYKSLEVKI